MRPAAALVLGLAFALAARAVAADEPPGALGLDAADGIEALRVEDLDGDGLGDVLGLAGREVRVWRGRRDAPPAPAPTWRISLPEDASYFDVLPGAAGGAPSLGVLAGDRLVRVPTTGAAETLLSLDVAWGPSRALLGDFARGRAVLLPSATGWRWFPEGVAGAEHAIDQPPRRFTTVAGAFLDDAAVAEERWAEPFLVAPASGGGGSVWILGPGRLRSFALGADGRLGARTLPTEFLTNEAGRQIRDRLVDLDADGTPDLCHEATSNLEGVYAFFRAPPAGQGDAFGAARAIVRLSGFQLPAAYPDLDGDGRPDLVVTTIEIDTANTLRAIRAGSVVARTRAFRNRSAAGGEFFPATPDAERESDVGVAIRFSYTGAIDVERSYTILASADLDGDRRRDLVVRTGPDALAVWAGAPQGVWAASPRRVPIPPMAGSPRVDAHAADLDGNGKDDLVLLYAAPTAGRSRIVVLPSR